MKHKVAQKEIGYRLKDDLSHMYRFLIRQTIKIYIRKETNTYEMVREKENKVSKGSHKYTNEIVA